MFQIGIGKRNYDFGIDYDLLAERTENYVSADISLVIDTAARLAFRRKIGKITMSLLEEAISQTKPSLTLEQIKRHEACVVARLFVLLAGIAEPCDYVFNFTSFTKAEKSHLLPFKLTINN